MNNPNSNKAKSAVKAQIDIGLDKLPPQAIEFEEVVLGALMIVSCYHLVSEILIVESNEKNNKVTGSFYKEAHNLIYAAITSLYENNLPCNILTVTHELKSKGKLDLAGGPYYVSQLTNKVAGSANIEYHARIIQEKYLQRQMISAAMDLAKGSYDDTGDALQLLFDFGSKADKLKDSIQVKDVVINSNSKLVTEDKILTFKGSKVLSVGNLCAIVAPPGTGKSQVCEAIACSIINQHSDTLGFKVDSRVAADNGILYVDTERSNNDCIRGFYRMKLRSEAHREENSYLVKKNGDLNGVVFKSFVQISDKKLRRLRIENQVRNGGYRMLMIDGITDLIRDPNDLGEAGDVVSWLISLANIYNIGILTTIHDNPVNGQTKPRGHMGSELYRKVEGMLLLRRNPEDKDMREITSDFQFGKVRNAKDTGLGQYFKYNEDKGMFLSEQFEPSIKTGQNEIWRGYMEFIFAENKKGLRIGDLAIKLADVSKKSIDKCKKVIAEFRTAEILEYNDETKILNLWGMGNAPF